MCIRLLQFGAVAFNIAFLRERLRAEHRDDVEQRHVAQRIMYDVEARPAPQRDIAKRKAFRRFLNGHDGAMSNVAIKAGIALADHLRADARAKTISAKDKRARDAPPVLRCDDNMVALVFKARDSGVLV